MYVLSYRFTSLGKLNYMATFSSPNWMPFMLLFGLCFMCTMLGVRGSLLTSPAAPLLIRLTTQQTDWQYSYYAKNIKGCLSSEMIYIERDTLVGLHFSTVLKILAWNNYLAHQLASNTKFRQLNSLKALQ